MLDSGKIATAPFNRGSLTKPALTPHACVAQVTLGNYVVKENARKVRRLQNGNVLTGFAGAAVDAITLFERLEGKLEQYPQVQRADSRGRIMLI
jgi:hypothetical protein